MKIEQTQNPEQGESVADLTHSEFSYSVRELPEHERPRARLLEHGAPYLSMPEILSILIGTGQEGLSSTALSINLLKTLTEDDRDIFKALQSATPEELMQVHGIGEAKAALILAALELGKRVFQPPPSKGTVVDNPAVAAAALSPALMWATEERFAVVMLDIKNRILGHKVITLGTASETLVHPVEIFRAILRSGAVQAIVAHNHPSGSLDPSSNDILVTKDLLKASQVIRIPILDHLIIGSGGFISLRETSTLWQEFEQY
jgi:DNA repair protein RadC